MSGAVVEVAGECPVELGDLGGEGVAFGSAGFGGGELFGGCLALRFEVAALVVEVDPACDGVVEGDVGLGDLVAVSVAVEGSVVFVEHGLGLADFAFEVRE